MSATTGEIYASVLCIVDADGTWLVAGASDMPLDTWEDVKALDREWSLSCNVNFRCASWRVLEIKLDRPKPDVVPVHVLSVVRGIAEESLESEINDLTDSELAGLASKLASAMKSRHDGF